MLTLRALSSVIVSSVIVSSVIVSSVIVSSVIVSPVIVAFAGACGNGSGSSGELLNCA